VDAHMQHIGVAVAIMKIYMRTVENKCLKMRIGIQKFPTNFLG
jgi:hypothetical protein